MPTSVCPTKNKYTTHLHPVEYLNSILHDADTNNHFLVTATECQFFKLNECS